MKLKKLKSKAIKYKSLNRLIALTTNCGLSAFFYGFCSTYFNAVAFRDIIKIYHIESFPRAATEGLLTGCISFTGALGSILSLCLVERISRRKCLMIMSGIAIALSLLLMIPNIWVLATVRLLQGIVIGIISCITPLYISEMMPKSVSGPFWSYHQCLFVFGLSFPFILKLICAQMMTPLVYWRIVFGFPILTCIIQIYNFAYIFPQESPKFLIMHDNEEKAKETLNFLYKEKYVDKVMEQIIEAVEYIQQDQSGSQSNEGEGEDKEDLQKPLTRSMERPPLQLMPMTKIVTKKLSLNEIFLKANLKKQEKAKAHHTPNNKTALFVAFFLSIQQPFLGGPAVINYSGDLIEGIFPKLENIFPIIINITGIVGSIISIYILAQFGRRDIILIGTSAQALCLFLAFLLCLAIDYQHPQQASHIVRVSVSILFILIRVILSATFAPVTDLYTAEIVQANILSWCSLCQWIIMGVVTTLFPVFCDLNANNPAYAFFIFGAITGISFFVSRSTVIETKNKTEIEVRKDYDQKFPD